SRRRRFVATANRRPLAHGGAPARWLGLLLRRRCLGTDRYRRRWRGRWRGVEIGDGFLELRFGRGRRCKLVAGAETVLRRRGAKFVHAGRRVTVAIAIVAIAPAATAAAPPPSPPFAIAILVRTVAALGALRLGRLAMLVGDLVARFFVAFGNGLARRVGWIFGRPFLDRDVFAMLAAVAPITTAASASAAPPPPPARFAFAFAVLGYGAGRGRFDVALLHLLDNALAFEVVIVLQRRGDGLLVLLGERACGLGRMHLLAAIDHKGLRRHHGSIGDDGQRDGKTFLQAAQMGALLVEHVERHIGPGAGDEIVSGAAHQLLFERAQHLERQRR